MPSLKKKALSLYLRTGCERQLVLNLYSDVERRDRGMPPRQQARAGLGLTGAAGYEWQDEKVNELVDVFGPDSVHVNPTKLKNRPQPTELADVLAVLKPYQFVVEAHYDAQTQTFLQAVGLQDLRDSQDEPLGVGNAYPDIIQVLPSARQCLTVEHLDEDLGLSPSLQAVLPTGEMDPLSASDDRLRLRVIDIKLAAEPGAHYFAEVVYYSLTLSAWLIEHGWNDRFVVVAAPAVWPGSYEASAIRLAHNRAQKEGRKPTPEELALALQDDIEVAPFDVFAPRLLRFFQKELPYVLNTPWNELAWHVLNTCNGCEFLGYPWRDRDGNVTQNPLHCWPSAEAGKHLSRVVGLTRGGAKLLKPAVPDVAKLAAMPVEAGAFDISPTLRARRHLFPHRAQSLETGSTNVIPQSGGDALMPKWPDLHLYVFLDFDLSSAITATFSLRGFWKEPLPYGSGETSKTQRWSFGKESPFQEVFLVDRRDLDRERDELLKFLRSLKQILEKVSWYDEEDGVAGRRGDVSIRETWKRSSYQIYLWDEAQRRHLIRVVGRHLPAILADSKLRDLAWLFPPPELLVSAEEASYNSPLTMVSTVVQNTIAAPVPHHYTLLDVVKTYHPDQYPDINVHPLYREPLSDLIPGERLHEMWTRSGNYTQTQRTIEETTAKKLQALAYVVAQLERELKERLNRAAAPTLGDPDARPTGLPAQSLLWYEYARLNWAVQQLEEQVLRAMPAHEREARFKAARLTQRLEGDEKEHARLLISQSVGGRSIPPGSMIYRLSDHSREFNASGLSFVLSPRSDPTFLGQSAYPLVKKHDLLTNGNSKGSVLEAGFTKVSILAIDRIHGLIALQLDTSNIIEQLEDVGIVDLRRDVMIDPVNADHLLKKLRLTLQGIGHPPSAGVDLKATNALGGASTSASPNTSESPASEFLWRAQTLSRTPVPRGVAALRLAVEQGGVHLNESQWLAFDNALTHRLALIWGPPGTGKSQTLRAIIAGLICDAVNQQRPLCLLVSANTYTAIDNVLLGLDTLLQTVLPGKPHRMLRLQSPFQDPPTYLADHPDIEPVRIDKTKTSQQVQQLQAELETPRGITLVGSTPQQLYNLGIATKNKSKAKETAQSTQRQWFDVLVIDEASQLGVAESTLVVSKATEEARFILAGDDKQLPPIQPAPPPTDLEHVVGSVYSYIRHHHKVKPTPLQINYRSCKTIVDFTKHAGYDPGLEARFPDLRLRLINGSLPSARPKSWPTELHWTPGWADVLDPAHPAVCYLYDDDVSGQANTFEADSVAAMLWLLYHSLDSELVGDGGAVAELTPHKPETFWKRAVGVVTPHRAQMGKIVSRLQAIFPDHDPELIWGAVDTVERFQGQQRDVIVASFGLGDADMIRSEDEFLYSLNRFNVMASRARAKLVVMLTRSIVDHLSDDSDVLGESRLLKNYAESYCRNPVSLELGYVDADQVVKKPGVLRRR